LQDINAYMKANNSVMGDLRKTTLRLGNGHEVTFVQGNDQIKAIIKEISDGETTKE
jgi:hypothetical protein